MEYIESEISYLQRWLQDDRVQAPQDQSATRPPVRVRAKLTISADRFALLMRAARERGYVESPSLRHLFHVIAPHISTLKADNPSADNLRSKSYPAERSDIEAVVSMLEELANAVRKF